MFVLVTIANNGVRHAWGPFESRSAAQKLQRKWEKEHPNAIDYGVFKVLDPEDTWVGETP